MIRAVGWTCVLALVGARIYDRCELARDLENYGVQRDHISTWVCIAEHESQYDTAAQNHGSGDHGIFQISELYWCGPGKACGVPCTAFRDEDIRDDIECSMIIHKEHTRLQGDGFLAWVVYAQHCKHNTKKYLAGCDGLPKNVTTKIGYKTYANDYFEKNATTYRTFDPPAVQQNYRSFQQNSQHPSYLAVSQLFQNSFNDFEESYTGGGIRNWANFKVDNVDELTLPQFNNRPNIISIPRTTIATTTTTYAPPVKPWRVIETNQFRNRNRIKNIDMDAEQSTFGKNEISPRYENLDTAKYSYSDLDHYPKTSSVATSVYSAPILSTYVKPEEVSKSTYKPSTYAFPEEVSKSTYKPSTYAFPEEVSKSTYKPSTYAIPEEVSKPTYKPSTYAFTAGTTTTTNLPLVTQTTKVTQRFSLTPTYQVYQPTRATSLPKFTQHASTARPLTTSQPWYDRQQFRNVPSVTFTSRPTFATRSWTTAAPIKRPYESPSITYRSPTTYRQPSTYRSSAAAYRSPGVRPTQSIFDLYLNPTKPPSLPPYNFKSSNDSPYKLKIFSGGTTPAPSHHWSFRG